MTSRIATTFLTIATILLFVFNLSLWLWTSVVDTDSFVDSASNALKAEDSREAVAERIVGQLLSERPLLLLTIGDDIAAVVAAILDTDRFATLFERLASTIHRVLTSTGIDEITIDVSGIRDLVNGVAEILNRDAGDTRIANQPDQIVIFEGRDFPALRQIAGTIPWVSFISGVLAAGLLAMVFVWARDRVVALRRLGIMLAVVGLFTSVLIFPVRSTTLASFPDANQRIIAGNLFDAFARQLLAQSLLLLVVGASLYAFVVVRARSGTASPALAEEPLVEPEIA